MSDTDYDEEYETDPAERRRSLEQFANASGQPNQPVAHGHALVRPTSTLAPLGAQPVYKERKNQKVLAQLKELAAMAGNDWFYRYPVKSKDGSTTFIEGPSIKLANAVARVFGNCVTEVREVDVGDAFVFYARFSDIETGFSMERAYRQRKTQQSFKTKDAERQLDIAYQIGQSKAIRNVICNSIGTYTDWAFVEARGSLVNKIGKDLNKWRQDTLDAIARLPVDIKRVNAIIGRGPKEWLADDIARIVSMGRAINDGMATIDDTFPPLEEKAPPSAAEPLAKEPVGAEVPASPAAAPADRGSGTGARSLCRRRPPAGRAGAAAGRRHLRPQSTRTVGLRKIWPSTSELVRRDVLAAADADAADEVVSQRAATPAAKCLWPHRRRHREAGNTGRCARSGAQAMKPTPLDYELAKLIDQEGMPEVIAALAREAQDRKLLRLHGRLTTVYKSLTVKDTTA